MLCGKGAQKSVLCWVVVLFLEGPVLAVHGSCYDWMHYFKH